MSDLLNLWSDTETVEANMGKVYIKVHKILFLIQNSQFQGIGCTNEPSAFKLQSDEEYRKSCEVIIEAAIKESKELYKLLTGKTILLEE